MTTRSESTPIHSFNALGTSQPAPTCKPKSRRVEPNLRKRAAFSCDRCKKRRRKCVPSSGGSSCQLCGEKGTSCTTTIPRKRYSDPQSTPDSQEMSLLTSLMDRLIAKLFPEFDTREKSQLTCLAEYVEKHDLQIRLLGENVSVTSKGSSLHPVVAVSKSVSKSVPSYLEQRSYGCNGISELSSSAVELSLTAAVPTSCNVPAKKYERLLQNASGTVCYFGPSSSMAFVMQLREEVVSTSLPTKGHLETKQQRLCQSFAADGSLATMETMSQAESLTNQEGEDPYTSNSYPVHGSRWSERSSVLQSVAPSSSRKLKNLLPSRREVEELVEVYFVHVHPNMILFHRPLFETALDSSYTSDREHQTFGWTSCFCLVIAFGCYHTIATTVYADTSRSHSLHRLQQSLAYFAMENMTRLIQIATLQSVQALALLSLYLSTQNQRNASWVMMGCAIRMATSLGMHRDERPIQQKTRSTSVERELKKRVWWSLYVSEQYNCALFGRPSAADEQEINNTLPSESLLDEGYHQPPGLLYHEVCLAQIVGRVRRLQSDQKDLSRGEGVSPLPDAQAVRNILHELDAWYDKLPPFFKCDASKQDSLYPNHIRPLLVIRLRYQHARLLLTRPYHLSAIQRQSSVVQDEFAIEFSDICVASALETWQLSLQLSRHGLFNGEIWLDGIFLYQAGMVLALACLDTKRRLRVSQTSASRDSVCLAVEKIPELLRNLPQDNPMGRMVQIVDDFSKIVLSMTSAFTTPGSNNEYRPSDHPDPWVNSASRDYRSVSTTSPQLNEPRTNPPYERPAYMDVSLGSGSRWQLGEDGDTDARHNDEAFLGSIWTVQSTQLMDYMLDCDLSQIFGFGDGEGPETETPVGGRNVY